MEGREQEVDPANDLKVTVRSHLFPNFSLRKFTSGGSGVISFRLANLT